MAQRRYTPEQKEAAIHAVLTIMSEGTTRKEAISRVADQEGIGPETLRSWTRGTRPDRETGVPDQHGTANDPGSLTASENPWRDWYSDATNKQPTPVPPHGSAVPWRRRRVIGHNRDTLPKAFVTALWVYDNEDFIHGYEPLDELGEHELRDLIHTLREQSRVFVEALALLADDYFIQ